MDAIQAILRRTSIRRFRPEPVPRGVIEPPVEYVLFSLEKGKVHPEPVDTPKGYWVVRRNE